MRRTRLWLLASLGLAWITSVTDGAPLKVMSAPNLLRVGTAENVFVECQDCGGQGPMEVRISIWNHPTKTEELKRVTVTLNEDNKYQAFGEVVIPLDSFNRDPTVKQYVYLRADFPGHTLEKVVLVSFQSGYIFIQTDKTLYTPDDRVHFRVFALTPRMRPIGGRDSGGFAPALQLETVTPEGIVVFLESVSLRSGMYTGSFQLGDISSVGQWKIVSRFQSSPQQSYSAEFEVKKQVLPSFEVKLIPDSPFYYYDAQSFDVRVKAIYLFGKEVNGTAYVVFGVIKDGSKKPFPTSLQRIVIADGEGQAALQKEHILRTFPNIEDLVGGFLFVTATVYTESGSEMVEGELRNLQIVKSPYFINFDKTPKYFKAGMPFYVTVTVTNPDGTPAEGVPVVVEPGQNVHGTTRANGRTTLTVNTRASDTHLTITARTSDNSLPANRQTSESMEAKPHHSRSQSTIDIDVISTDVTLGTNLKVRLILNGPSGQFEVTFLIQSRGQLVGFGKQLSEGPGVIALNIPVTKQMLPSFRLVAYFHPSPSEVVSDSVWVDVDDSCLGTLKLEPEIPLLSYEPRRMFSLRVTADPGATVALVAVDRGVHVLNKNHILTQKKVWEIVEKADTGCSPGGGENSMSVFFDAGLMFQTDTADGTPYRREVKCPTPRVRNRRSEDDDSFMDSSEIVSRTKFPESWAWIDFQIPACPANSHCEVNRQFFLPDTITTWEFTGISLSENNGICVGKPLDVVVSKQFFIDLKLPHSAVVGEQIEIRAILHNYMDDPITVRLELIESTDICSSAWKRGKFRTQVRVGPSTTRAVPFVIIPMKEGELNIEVKAAVRDSWHSDAVWKRLRVVPVGVLTKVNKVVTLDPKGGTQEVIFNSSIPRTEMVPNTPSSSKVFITAGPLVENVIEASSMGRLLVQPTGSGELNMNYMTQPVIATVYLDKTHQWEAVGLEKRSEALVYVRIGVQNEMAYAKADGSFAVFPQEKSSTWLTAFVVKVFSMAYSLVHIDHSVICNAVKFLILNPQLPSGMFLETGTIIRREDTGDVLGADSDASMTAFCLIALQESQRICIPHVNSLPQAISKAVSFLENRLPTVTNPYAVALTSYALANVGKLNKETLYNFVSPEMTHWISPQGHIFSLEATAYALLALVKAELLEDARPIVRWFTKQQKVAGGYGSTQATLMVYQAVSEYWAVAKQTDYNLDVDLELPGRPVPYKYRFTRDNLYTTRTSRRFEANGNVKVRAKGTGEATVTLVTQYYALPKDPVSDCTKFNISVEFSLATVDERDGDIYSLRMAFFSKNKHEETSLSILDITVPTGFIPMVEDLNALSEGRGAVISQWEFNKDLSEKGSIVLYLPKVAHDRVEELRFRMRQVYRVGVLQPASVSIYEYYDETKCVRYYHPEKKDGRLLRLCKGDECFCAEEYCSMQRKGLINSQARTERACESSMTDFVYKVTVEDVHYDVSFDVYSMRIERVVKEGTSDRSPQGQLRKFLGFSHCRQSLDLQKSRSYLIVGSAEDIIPDVSTQTFDYLFNERTWIEFWPRENECQTEQHRPACLGIEALAQALETFGCISK